MGFVLNNFFGHTENGMIDFFLKYKISRNFYRMKNMPKGVSQMTRAII